MSTPKVSVIVPCYNQAQYLDECLQSVLMQSYTNWECIIVNDGSTDDTQLIAEILIKEDSRIKYIFQENKGLSSARNSGIKISKGKFILPLDADDKIGSMYIEEAMKIFRKKTKIKIVYCKAKKFGDVYEDWDLDPYSLDVFKIKNVIFCSAFFRKTDWYNADGYDENLKKGWEDWEFWISILKSGGEVYRINNFFFYYRVKANSMVRRMNPEIESEILSYLHQKHPLFFNQKAKNKPDKNSVWKLFRRFGIRFLRR